MAVITIAYMNKELIGLKKTDSYSLYNTPFIVNNQTFIIKSVDEAYSRFMNLSNNADSTWSYNKYNIFSLSAGNHYFYTMYQLIVAAIRDRVGDDRPLWMQCWLNYHKEDEVLNWHGHSEDYLVHGYLSIDPKDTVTEFKEFMIENKIGNLYIGRTGVEKEHRVVVKKPYDGYRITIAFDVIDYNGKLATNLSFIPIP